jgi:hypothetical protein
MSQHRTNARLAYEPTSGEAHRYSVEKNRSEQKRYTCIEEERDCGALKSFSRRARRKTLRAVGADEWRNTDSKIDKKRAVGTGTPFRGVCRDYWVGKVRTESRGSASIETRRSTRPVATDKNTRNALANSQAIKNSTAKDNNGEPHLAMK